MNIHHMLVMIFGLVESIKVIDTPTDLGIQKPVRENAGILESLS